MCSFPGPPAQPSPSSLSPSDCFSLSLSFSFRPASDPPTTRSFQVRIVLGPPTSRHLVLNQREPATLPLLWAGPESPSQPPPSPPSSLPLSLPFANLPPLPHYRHDARPTIYLESSFRLARLSSHSRIPFILPRLRLGRRRTAADRGRPAAARHAARPVRRVWRGHEQGQGRRPREGKHVSRRCVDGGVPMRRIVGRPAHSSEMGARGSLTSSSSLLTPWLDCAARYLFNPFLVLLIKYTSQSPAMTRTSRPLANLRTADSLQCSRLEEDRTRTTRTTTSGPKTSTLRLACVFLRHPARLASRRLRPSTPPLEDPSLGAPASVSTRRPPSTRLCRSASAGAPSGRRLSRHNSSSSSRTLSRPLRTSNSRLAVSPSSPSRPRTWLGRRQRSPHPSARPLLHLRSLGRQTRRRCMVMTGGPSSRKRSSFAAGTGERTGLRESSFFIHLIRLSAAPVAENTRPDSKFWNRFSVVVHANERAKPQDKAYLKKESSRTARFKMIGWISGIFSAFFPNSPCS